MAAPPGGGRSREAFRDLKPKTIGDTAVKTGDEYDARIASAHARSEQNLAAHLRTFATQKIIAIDCCECFINVTNTS